MSQLPNIPKLHTTTSNTSYPGDNSVNKKFPDEKQKRIDMGLRWSEEELEIFLRFFRKSGLDEADKMQEKLLEAGYRRSVDNLRAVFLKNKNFLTYNPSCTARDLAAIMADHYETMENELQLIPERSSNKVRDNLSENASDKKRTPLSIATKGGNFLDEPVRSKPFDDSLNQKRKLTKIPKNQYSSEDSDNPAYYKPKKLHVTSSVYPAEKPKKTRKSSTIKGKFPLDLDFCDPELLKNAEVWSRTCSGKSNRKSINFSLRRSSNERSYPLSFLKFIDCELFYSTIDEPFYSFNEFDTLLGERKESEKLSRKEWSFLRNCMGKPRRFSSEFIKQQMNELNTYRSIARNYLSNKISIPENKIHPLIAQRIKELKPLQVSQVVLAMHPQCNHIHAGSILTLTGDHVIIKFFPTELGAISVFDIKVRTLTTEVASQLMDYFNGSNLRLTGIPMNRMLSDNEADKIAIQNRLIQDLDFNALSLFIKILERKTALVSDLRNFNDRAENEGIDLDERFYQEYGWTGVQIKLLDNALKHIVTKTRLRGLNNYNIDQISNNLDLLMANPLKALAELEQKSSEDVDPKVIQEIKGLLNKNIEQKISDEIRILTEKYGHAGQSKSIENKVIQNQVEKLKEEKESETMPTDIHEEKIIEEEKEECNNKKLVEEQLDGKKKALKEKIIEDVDEDKQKDLKRMVDNMIGVILSLKLSGDLNMTENRYLTDLHNHIFEGNSEEFHEINTVLLNICSK